VREVTSVLGLDGLLLQIHIVGVGGGERERAKERNNEIKRKRVEDTERE